jgi:hypothetical protein
MASNIETQRFAARANIFRYQKLLTTYLTEEERRFVERRLEEEKAALHFSISPPALRIAGGDRQ